MSKQRSMKNLILMPSYQLRLILFAVGVLTIGTLVQGISLQYIISKNLGQVYNVEQTEKIWVIIRPSIAVGSLISFLIITLFLVIVVALLSHKLVGPMLKATGYINKINNGVLPKKSLVLRKGDEGQVLCDAVNDLQSNLNTLFEDLKSLKQAIKDQETAEKLEKIISKCELEK